MNEDLLLREIQRLSEIMENYCQVQAAKRMQMCLANNRKLNKLKREMA